jgi:hypothetical protein
MDATTSRPVKYTSFLLCILLCLGFSGSRTVAAALDGLWMAGGNTGTTSGESGLPELVSAAAVAHSFTGDEMKNAYGQMYGIYIQAGEQFASGAGWRFESGLLIAVGDPLFPDPTWNVDLDSSSMEMMVIPLGGSFLYEFSGSGPERTFAPYLGLGLDGYFGFERTSVKISRFPEGKFDWNDTKYRYTWTGHALAGATIRLTEKVRGLVEIRWTQGMDGSDVDQSFSEEELNEGWREVAKAVQRPDFNFTGWSVSIGARW